MTRNRRPFAQVRARLHADERGFSLLETIIAVTVIFGSLAALAYSATVGFGYQGLSRQRQAGTGIANQLMEEIRGLAYENVQAGLSSTDLSGDPNIVDGTTCGDAAGTYRFLSCTPDPDVPGSGEVIVHSPGLSTTTPLVPHRSSTLPNTDPTRDGTTFGWSTYVTRDDSVASSPYRVTVLVTWSGGRVNAPNKLVRVQSLFWSPIGCRSTSTHPFAAPCQPFFYGTATVPQTSVTVSGSIEELTFTSGELLAPSAFSSVQQEQIQKAQGTWHGPEATVTDATGTGAAGGTTLSTSADSDPATALTEYSRARCPEDGACASGSVSSSASGNTITFTAPAGTIAESDSTTAVGGGNVCPPPPDVAESDGLQCAGGRVLQAGILSTTLNLSHSTNPGAATVVRLQAPSTASKTFVHRTAFPSTNGCTPTSTTDGCLRLTANRYLGTLNIGGLPAGVTPEAGWSGANPWNGYFLSLVGYQDALAGSVGTESPLPTASMSGTIYYFNGTGYSSVSVTNAALNGLSASYTLTRNVSGKDVTVTIATDPVGMAAGSTSLSPTAPGGSAIRTDVDAQAIPPALAVRYTIVADAVTLADLTVTVNLGVLQARGTYAPAPVEGT